MVAPGSENTVRRGMVYRNVLHHVKSVIRLVFAAKHADILIPMLGKEYWIVHALIFIMLWKVFRLEIGVAYFTLGNVKSTQDGHGDFSTWIFCLFRITTLLQKLAQYIL